VGVRPGREPPIRSGGITMHALTMARPEPYVWVSWLTKLLAGESSCIWSAWLRAHYQTAKHPSDFDMGAWQLAHSALSRRTATEHEQAGYTVFTEDQNSFAIKGKAGTLSGKPDIVAVKELDGWVIDTKTGSPKASDRIQVMIYMWALPIAIPAFKDVTFHGKVMYGTGYNIIRPEQIDTDFIKMVSGLMKKICGDEEPHKAPSFKECQHCPITAEDCTSRIGKANVYEGVTEEF
jgi:hypothetical protein